MVTTSPLVQLACCTVFVTCSHHCIARRSLLLSEISTDELCLSESGTEVQLLVAGMYDAALPLTWDNVGPLMELARKYDVRDIEHNCMQFVQATPWDTDNLPWC